MSVEKLPDLSSCLKYCIIAKKNLIYFYKKQENNDSGNANIDIERQANIIKNTIERGYMDDGIKCSVMKKIPEEEELESFTDKGAHNIEILIIPNVESLDDQAQIRLVQMMTQGHRLFIGMISWEDEQPGNESKGKDNKIPPRDMEVNKVLTSHITVRDWLKHRFWIACFEPDQNEVVTIKPNNTGDALNITYMDVNVHPSVRRYILDIMIHLRMHRLVDITKGGGVHTGSLKDVIILSKLISMDKFKKSFVTPEHVKMACTWYFPMHLELVRSSAMDVTVLYGSKPNLVDGILEKIAHLKLTESNHLQNPLFLETLVVKDVIKKVVPPV